MKKIFVFTMALMVLFSSFCFAAVSSSGRSSFRPSTSISSPSIRQAATPSTSQSYKPSASPKSYTDNAPSSQAGVKPQQQIPQPQSSGGFWRNAGIFGSGMLFGSLLSNALGFGHIGMMSSLFGMLVNVLIVMGIVMAVSYAWRRLRNQTKKDA